MKRTDLMADMLYQVVGAQQRIQDNIPFSNDRFVRRSAMECYENLCEELGFCIMAQPSIDRIILVQKLREQIMKHLRSDVRGLGEDWDWWMVPIFYKEAQKETGFQIERRPASEIVEEFIKSLTGEQT